MDRLIAALSENARLKYQGVHFVVSTLPVREFSGHSVSISAVAFAAASLADNQLLIGLHTRVLDDVLVFTENTLFDKG